MYVYVYVHGWTITGKFIPPMSIRQTEQLNLKKMIVLNHMTQKRGQIGY